MKIFTHNLLTCKKIDCGLKTYPLQIIPNKVITKPHELDTNEMKRFIQKLDWNGIIQACNDLNSPLPFNYETLTDEQKNSDEFFKFMNHLLFETLIEEGAFKCKGCDKVYPITNGILNINLEDDELERKPKRKKKDTEEMEE